MATYSTIEGQRIQSFATDPAATYAAAGTWTTRNALNTGRFNPGGCGIETAALCCSGGQGGPPWSNLTNTEIYDGTNWTEGGAMNTGRRDTNANGTSTAALCAGGYRPSAPYGSTKVEEYNGTSWTEQNACEARTNPGAGGTQTAGLVFGGKDNGAPTQLASTQEYDGTNWTEVGDMNTARYNMECGGVGTQTAGICYGGSPALKTHEAYNGTAWTTAADMITGRNNFAGFGTQTSVIAAASVISAVTELWDGTSWAEGGDTNTTRNQSAGAGADATSGLAFGGAGNSTLTEEWSLPALGSVTIAREGQVWYNSASNVLKGFGKQGTGAWASGGAMTDSRKQFAGDGIQTAAIAMGGTPASSTETYNGSTWTEVNDLNTSRNQLASSTQGSTTASLVFGGASNPPTPTTADDETELWNGSVWAEQSGDLNTARRTPIGAGTTTAALCAGGQTSPTTYMNESEEYNGTSWAEGDNLNTGRNAASGCGTQTAALIVGGRIPASTNKTETYDGTSWTEVNNCNTARNQGCTGIGVQTGALFVGGQPSPAYVEQWDGTSWTEVADLATGRSTGAGAGTSVLGLVGGGETTDVTEEWTVPAATKTFTSS